MRRLRGLGLAGKLTVGLSALVCVEGPFTSACRGAQANPLTREGRRPCKCFPDGRRAPET
jgi:hypothetical protein